MTNNLLWPIVTLFCYREKIATRVISLFVSHIGLDTFLLIEFELSPKISKPLLDPETQTIMQTSG